MKTKISDMMDHLEENTVAVKERYERQEASAVRIKEATMQKIKNENTVSKRRMGKTLKAAAILAVVGLALVGSGTAAYAYLNWDGFARVSELSEAQVEEILNNHTSYMAAVGPDGSMIYYDVQGNEVLKLSAEEAAEYTRKMQSDSQKTREQLMQEYADIIDADQWPVNPEGIPLIPSGISELTTDEAGRFEDFILGSGYMVILRPEDASKYVLKAGDTVAITVTDEEDCILEFGMIRDGKIVETDTNKQQNHYRVFTVPEDGEYNFYIRYYSADKGIFTDCVLTVNEK